MSLKYTDGPVTLPTAAALGTGIRAALNSSNQVVAAGAGQRGIGHLLEDCSNTVAGRDRVAVRPWNSAGTMPGVANGAITPGVSIYAAGSGKVTATAIGNPIGVALSAAGADGDIIEFFPLPVDPELVTISYTATSADDTANSATIDTGFGVQLTRIASVQIVNGSNVRRVPAGAVTIGTGGSAGQFTVADANLAVNEVIVAVVQR